MVRGAIEMHGLEASQLELELTESAIMEDVEEARGVLDRLKARGIQISVDDFGTGYSSLAYLRRLPLDRLKIDRSFVNDVTDDPEDAVITTAIIGMAKTLGLKTLAEGIETPSQLAFFRERGCDEAQGFLLAKPMPSEELLAWWAAREAQ
jgi:EAL domain-containing protein (putative c-di-GMP-specific phosphodiesterase class I)